MPLAMYIISIANCLISTSFVLFVMPPRKKGPSNLGVIPLSYLLSALWSFALFRRNMVAVALLEFALMITPVAVFCAHDIWRNLFIRMLYQIGLSTLQDIRIPLNLYMEEEREFSINAGTENIEFSVYYVIMTMCCLIVLMFAFRAIVKRWSPEHKKIYTVLTCAVYLMGIINGIRNIGPEPETVGEANLSLKIGFVIEMLVLIAVNLLYNSYVNRRMEKENKEISMEISSMQSLLSGADSFADFLQAETKKLEQEGVSVNLVVVPADMQGSESLAELTKTLLRCARTTGTDRLGFSIIERNGMTIISLTDMGITDPFAFSEAEALAEKMGGTVDREDGISIFLTHNE